MFVHGTDHLSSCELRRSIKPDQLHEAQRLFVGSLKKGIGQDCNHFEMKAEIHVFISLRHIASEFFPLNSLDECTVSLVLRLKLRERRELGISAHGGAL